MLNIVKGPLDTGLSVWIIEPMRHKFGSVKLTKMLHLRRNDGVRADTTGHDDMGIVNDAFAAGPIHKGQSFSKKHLALKSGEAGIVLDIDFTTVGQNKGGTLSGDFVAAKF